MPNTHSSELDGCSDDTVALTTTVVPPNIGPVLGRIAPIDMCCSNTKSSPLGPYKLPSMPTSTVVLPIRRAGITHSTALGDRHAPRTIAVPPTRHLSASVFAK